MVSNHVQECPYRVWECPYRVVRATCERLTQLAFMWVGSVGSMTPT